MPGASNRGESPDPMSPVREKAPARKPIENRLRPLLRNRTEEGDGEMEVVGMDPPQSLAGGRGGDAVPQCLPDSVSNKVVPQSAPR